MNLRACPALLGCVGMGTYPTFLTSATSREHCLLFITGLDLAKESFYFGILVKAKEDSVYLEDALSNELFPIKLRQVLIARIG